MKKETGEKAETRSRLAPWTLLGLLGGVGAGLFFGEYCAGLKFVGDAYVGLLQMTVMPYIIVALVSNFGRLSMRQSRRLALVGGATLLVLWAIGCLAVIALAQTFPDWKRGSFFSTTITEIPKEFDLVALFIPSNVFESLSENHVPAVVLLSIWAGLVLAGTKNRRRLILQLDVLSQVLMRISHSVARLSPLGVFAIAASTAGTVTLDEFGRLQAYLVVYVVGAMLLGFLVLPMLVAVCTPFRYRDVILVSRDAMLTAFATGKLIVVLPMLIEETERLFADKPTISRTATPAVDVLYPIAYPFPHVGKLISMLFVPFAAWFLGNTLAWHEYPTLLSAGIFSYFGGPLLAMPFLLDLMHLPHDMFQLFLLTGVIGERVGDALGVVHLSVFTLLATCAFTGQLQVNLISSLKYVAIIVVVGSSTLGASRAFLSYRLDSGPEREEVVAKMQLMEESVKTQVFLEATPNPSPLKAGESLLARIRRRGIIRIGFNKDKLPFAYFNGKGDLVGFDIEMAYALASDLRVKIEFVSFDRHSLAEQLAQDDFDVAMSGLVGTLERSEAMQHTSPYMDVTLALAVPDYRVRKFRSLADVRKIQNLTIGYTDLSLGLVARLKEALPNATLIQLPTSQQFFRKEFSGFDALLISAEGGSAFTLLYPEFEVVIPNDLRVQLPLCYAIGARDAEMREFLQHWVELRRRDGTMQEYYEHWILGKTAESKSRRWSIVRDVLHWIE